MDQRAVTALEGELERAIKAGRDQQAGQLWERLLAAAPDHPRALMALGRKSVV